MKKMFTSVMAAALAVSLAACSSDSSPTEPSPTTGSIVGTVTAAPGVQINLSNARVAIYATVAEMNADRLIQQTALSGSSPTWSYRMDNVTPGTYYLDVCIAQGGQLLCAFFGNPSPIQVAAGQTTNASITFIP
jgi:ABC-type Fe3+-hydroxamate transport system substrate-binding protein